MGTRPRPEVRAVLLCERVIEEKDGVLTIVRMIDNIMVQAQSIGGSDGPDAMPKLPIQFWGLLSLKAGDARGEYAFMPKVVSPSGKQLLAEGPPPPRVQFEAADSGFNLMMQLQVITSEEGLYWFQVDVEGEDRPIARIPFRIVYARPSPKGTETR